jgi:predicted porin
MNKKLIALAVAGACVAPAVMAQTANPVTLYGRIYVTAESVSADSGPAGVANLSNRIRMVDQASYLGVRGTEDLGGGLKGVFQLETGFDPEATQSNFATRNSMVGLQGGWGTVGFGRWDTPMKMSQTAVDPWGDLTSGDITGAALDQGNFSRRANKQILYWSPSMGGFSVKAGYTPNEGKTADGAAAPLNPSYQGASLVYNKGPLYVAYAFEQHQDFITANGVGTAQGKATGNALAARFAFGNFRLSGQYGEYKKRGAGAATIETLDKSYMVGGDWAIGGGKHVLLGSYQNAQASGNGTDADCNMFSVGYRYDFSKRTFLIASYTDVQNSNGATARQNMNCNFGSAGQELHSFGVGVRHVF